MKKYKITLMIINFIFLLMLLPSLWLFPFLIMIFDAPSSMWNISNWLIFCAFASLPFFLLTSIVISFTSYIKGKSSKTMKILLLPLISVWLALLSILLWLIGL